MSLKEKAPVAGDAGASENGSELHPSHKAPNLKGQAWKAAAVETLAALHARFPACFTPATQHQKWPIKIGVHANLLAAAPDLLPDAVGRALAFYTSRSGYLRLMTEGRSRIDLNGAQFGCVTAEQAADAKQRLAKRQHRPAAPSTPKPPSPPRLTLAGLREAAARRRATP
jgi:sRNA-binding protein